MQSVAMQLIWAENLWMIDFRYQHATIMESFDPPRSTYTIDVRTTGVTNLGRTMRCTEVADRPFPDGEFFGRDIGDRWRYPIEMQNDELLDAIASFRSAQELGLAYVHNRLRLPVPRTNHEWMRYRYAVPPEAAVVAQADGVKLDIHGAGIEIVHPDFTIDYDYGPNGECDCFDAWRLALHRHRSHGLPWPVKGQLELRALLDDASADGSVLHLAETPFFVHPDFRSNWTPSRTNA